MDSLSYSLCTILCFVVLVIKLFVNVNALLNDLRLVVMKLPWINFSSRLFDISVKSSALLSIENNFDKTDFLLYVKIIVKPFGIPEGESDNLMCTDC